MITTLRNQAIAVALALLAPAAAVGACSSDNSNPQPGTPVYQVGDEAGPTTTSGDDSGTGAFKPDDSGAGGGNPDAPLTLLDGALVADASVCAKDGGCWSCSPLTTAEFLNQCTASQCTPFPNAQRLPSYDGGLPPLN